MKIAIFTDSYYPYVSGVTTVVENQARELIRLGHEVLVFRPKSSWRKKNPVDLQAPPDIPVEDVPASIPHKKIPNFWAAAPTFISSYKKIRKYKPDLIHVHTEWGAGWEGSVIAKKMGIPLVGTFHTFFADPRYIQNFPFPNIPLTSRLLWKFSCAFYNRCDRVIAPSFAVKRALLSHGVKKPLRVVSNGIPRPDFQPDSIIRDKKEKLGIMGPSFIYVGRVSEEKSFELCIHAFKKVFQKNPESRFVVIGGGPAMPGIDRLVEELGLQKAVIRLGLVEHDGLIQENLFRLGDVFVTASGTENQPVSILEALAFKRPVVGPAAKGIPELVQNNQNGILVEEGRVDQLVSAMNRFIENPSEISYMAENAGRVLDRHSMEAVGKDLLDVYEMAMAEKPEKVFMKKGADTGASPVKSKSAEMI